MTHPNYLHAYLAGEYDPAPWERIAIEFERLSAADPPTQAFDPFALEDACDADD